MSDFIETRIIRAVRKLITDQVNGYLEEMKSLIPVIEFGGYEGSNTVVPVITLSSCERIKKDRIIRQDAYSLTISITFPETAES